MNTVDTLQSTSRVREYLDFWAQHISEFLGNLLHLNVTTETVPSEKPTGSVRMGNEMGVWISLAAGSSVEQAFYFSGIDALHLAQILDRRPVTKDGALGSDERGALERFFSEIAAKIRSADWLGQDAQFKVSESKCPEWESAFSMEFRFSTEQDSLVVLHTQLSVELASILQSVQEKVDTEKSIYPAINPNRFRAAPEPLQDNRLELLMDVELEVVLRFGQREMLLRDVLNLTPGTVLELDQEVHDPVELLVGNKVVAWGEVVTIDGNYGLRITSLASRKERLESLRK